MQPKSIERILQQYQSASRFAYRKKSTGPLISQQIQTGIYYTNQSSRPARDITPKSTTSRERQKVDCILQQISKGVFAEKELNTSRKSGLSTAPSHKRSNTGLTVSVIGKSKKTSEPCSTKSIKTFNPTKNQTPKTSSKVLGNYFTGKASNKKDKENSNKRYTSFSNSKQGPSRKNSKSQVVEKQKIKNNESKKKVKECSPFSLIQQQNKRDQQMKKLQLQLELIQKSQFSIESQSSQLINIISPTSKDLQDRLKKKIVIQSKKPFVPQLALMTNRDTSRSKMTNNDVYLQICGISPSVTKTLSKNEELFIRGSKEFEESRKQKFGLSFSKPSNEIGIISNEVKIETESCLSFKIDNDDYSALGFTEREDCNSFPDLNEFLLSNRSKEDPLSNVKIENYLPDIRNSQTQSIDKQVTLVSSTSQSQIKNNQQEFIVHYLKGSTESSQINSSALTPHKLSPKKTSRETETTNKKIMTPFIQKSAKSEKKKKKQVSIIQESPELKLNHGKRKSVQINCNRSRQNSSTLDYLPPKKSSIVKSSFNKSTEKAQFSSLNPVVNQSSGKKSFSTGKSKKGILKKTKIRKLSNLEEIQQKQFPQFSQLLNSKYNRSIDLQ